MDLLRTLKNKPFCNELHFLLIALILFLISLKSPYFFILLGLYLIFLYRNTSLFYYSLLLIAIISALMGLKLFTNSRLEGNSYEGVVIEVKNEKSYLLRSGIIKLIVYDKNTYEVGDVVRVNGKINEIAPKGYPGDFDYQEYLRANGISYSFYAMSSTYLNKGFTLAIIKAKYLSYLKNRLSPSSYSYIESVVFGNNLLPHDIKDGYSILGISHILAISGMHIMMLYAVIKYLLLNIFHYYKDNIPIAIIAIYVVLIGAKASSLRALLFLILSKLNSKASIQYSKLDILSISAIFMLIINPFQGYYVGFILSYLVSFILIYMKDIIKATSRLKGMLCSYILIYLITLPFVLNMSNIISIFSLILSPILTLGISYILLPISYILALIPYLDIFLKYIFILLNTYIVNLSNMLPVIHMPYMNSFMILIYYLIFTIIIIAFVKERGRVLSFALMGIYLLAIKLLVVYLPIPSVTFLDCGQGDSTIIKSGSSVIVVDAFNSFDYLKDLGIDQIDYLVLTHSDSDHLGDYEEVLDFFDVGLVLYPKFDDKLDYLLRGYKALGIEAGYHLRLKNLDLSFISPFKDYDNSNMNSLVIKLIINKTSFLLCADITTEVEHDLVNKYKGYLRVDVLKAGHHGSITSSSSEFLNTVKPKYSIISAGLNNRYHHPDSGVVKRLKAISIVYNTINDGSITFRVKEDGYVVGSYR